MEYFVWLLQKDIITLEAQAGTEQLCRAAELKGRLLKLQTKPYFSWYGEELQRFCRFRLLKSQRETSLGAFAEHARAVRTWQSFDYNLWRACLEKPEQPRVAAEERFLQQVLAGKLVLGWSDAVPWWGLLNNCTTLKLALHLEQS